MGTKASRLRPRPFPPPLGPRLRGSIAAAHAEQPFAPSDARAAAHRVRRIAEALGLEATLYRGGLDVGGAELDHVWTVVEDRVVDPAVPLFSGPFVECVRAFVAGYVELEDLERCAHPYSIRWRVVGAFPAGCRYTGRPLWGSS
jgi:hypothetical protein